MSTTTRKAVDTKDATAALDRRCRRLTELLTTATGIKWTFGYIGNLARWGDDRSWYAFAEHPGRVGTPDDSIGGVPTDQLHELETMLLGALALTRIPGVKRRLTDVISDH